MSAMISLNKLSSSPNVNVNVKPNVNVNVNSQSSEKENDIGGTNDIKVVYQNDKKEEDYQNDIKELTSELLQSQNECQVLKIYIDMLKNNPIIYNGYIVADDETLMKFIQLLTSADDIQLDAEDIGEGCLSKKTYRKVHAIYVIKNNETKNLKYDYPKVMKELSDLGISTKFVF